MAPNQVIDPVVMADDDLAVAGPATGRDECRAGWRRRLVKLGITEARLQRRHVVLCQFDPGIQSEDVVSIDFGRSPAVMILPCVAFKAGVGPTCDAGDFALVLVANLVPEHRVSCLAIELPIVLRGMGQVFTEYPDYFSYLRRGKIAVLVSDLIGSALEMQVNPAIAVAAESRSHQVGGGGVRRCPVRSCGQGA